MNVVFSVVGVIVGCLILVVLNEGCNDYDSYNYGVEVV